MKAKPPSTFSTKTKLNSTWLCAFLVSIFTLVGFSAKSQSSFTFPEGYQAKDVNGELGARNDNDFDGDGITDLAIVCFKSDGSGPIVVVYLTSKWKIDKTYSCFTLGEVFENFTFEYSNNVLNLLSDGNAGRFGMNLELKYYANLKNMRLIGYGQESLGDMNNNGAYDKSINLLTGEYSISVGVENSQLFMRKVSIDVITLSNIEKYLDYLYFVGSDYIEE